MLERGLLVFSENLIALEYLLTARGLEGKIDLIYIDPPFATNHTFRVEADRANSISNSLNGTIAYTDYLRGNEYLVYLRSRLLLLRRLLSERGSIYLHIDCKMGHYVKVLMDEVFGAANFRNDITRIKCNPKNFQRKGYGNIKDMILFYSKSDDLIWHEPKIPYSENDKVNLFPKTDETGRRYTTIPLHAPGETRNGVTALPFKGIFPPKGRHWRSTVEELEKWDTEGLIEWSSTGNPRKKIYMDDQVGKRVQDIWEFKDPQYPIYPTEKNAAMLDLIICTSSNPDSIVLDCFAGSGATLRAAARNGRSWIGIDKSEAAIRTIQASLTEQATLFTAGGDYQFLTEEIITAALAQVYK